MTVAILGGSLSGNKGAASMVYAVADGVHRSPVDTEVLVFSPYAAEDRLLRSDLEIVDFAPSDMLVRMLPAAVLSVVTLRRWRPRRGPSGKLATADVVADVSGIAFMDGRGLPTLVYNVLVVLLPWAYGVPIVKVAQALGPFEGRLNRILGRASLSRARWVGLRGVGTAQNVERLGLTNAEKASDIAFILEVDDDAQEVAAALLPESNRVTLLAPSAVVQKACADEGIDYVGRMQRLADGLTDAGHAVVLIAHSARGGEKAGHTNDLPVCRLIANGSSADLLDREFDARELRAIIARSRLLVTSRFHGMISGLATRTPTFVIGWSHKYREVLVEFGLDQWAVDFRDLSDDDLLSAVVDLDAQGEAVRAAIDKNLPTVREGADLNIDRLLGVLGIGASSETRDLSPVIDNDLCIACGACVAADPTITLEIHPSKQMIEPNKPGDEVAASVCPSISVDYARLQAERFPGSSPGPFGVVESVTLAQSTDLDRNLEASSGGVIKELLTAYLDRNDVDAVIALGHVEGLEFEPRFVRSVDDIEALPGSIYHNLPKHRVLDLLRNTEGRFVLVGIPCEFEGIFNYISAIEPDLARKIHATVGLLCGWQYSYHALRAICEFKGIDFDAITDVSYRGGGPVGKLRITRDGGRVAEINRRVDFSYQVAFDRHFNTPRCHLCINHANFLADIVVGDAWLPSTVGTKSGISLVIARTEESDRMLRELREAGRIALTDVSTAEIEESQTHRIAFGDFAYAYAEQLRTSGHFVPDLRGPNYEGHRPVSPREVERFQSELRRKLELQRAGRYRYLRWRKATRELPKFLQRYFRWFLVRILRIKSLTGKREEVARDQLSDFR